MESVQQNIFFNLEKRNYNKKTIGELRLQDGSTTKNEKLILNHIEAFYKDLLTSQIPFNDDTYDSFVQNLQIPKLSDAERDSLEGPLRFDECQKVLKTLKVLQTKLDMWSSRDLTLFGKVMLIKTLGISQLIYSASNLPVPTGIEDSVKTKCFKFLWRNKKDKIKRTGLYQDTNNGGLRMTYIGLMFKSLKLAWIPRILSAGKKNWCTVPNTTSEKWKD